MSESANNRPKQRMVREGHQARNQTGSTRQLPPEIFKHMSGCVNYFDLPEDSTSYNHFPQKIVQQQVTIILSHQKYQLVADPGSETKRTKFEAL